MAESTGGPSSSDDALSKRITDWFNSPQGQQHFQEGFAQKSQYLNLHQFKEREAKSAKGWRYEFPSKQGGVHEGSSPGQAMNFTKCDVLGHIWSDAWESDDKFVRIQKCIRCHLVRQQKKQEDWSFKQDYGLWQMNEHLLTKEQAEEALALPEPESSDEDLHLMCLWCGKVCDDIEARYAHEDECAPA